MPNQDDAWSPAELARAARTIVTAATVGEVERGRHQRVRCTVIDHDGEPIVAVVAGQGLTAASVRLRLRGEGDMGVCLSGRLSPLPSGTCPSGVSRWAAKVLQVCLDGGATLSRLTVDTVVLTTAHEAQGAVRVDLFEYALAEPDVVAAHGPRIAAHLNHAHAGPVRAAAAQGVGVDPDRIIGAAISSLDADGVDLAVVDAFGARFVRFEFGRPVTTVDELAEELRAALVAPDHRTRARPPQIPTGGDPGR